MAVRRSAAKPQESRSGLLTLKPDLTLPKGYLSKSSIEMYLRCPRQFEFAYVKGIKSPPGVALVEGSSHGESLNMNNEHFIKRGLNLKIPVVVEKFKDEFSTRSKEIPKEEWTKVGEKPDDVYRRGSALLTRYMKDVAPGLHPVSVEKRIEIMLGGVPVLGYSDVEEEMSIWDYKAVARAKSQNDADADIQFSIYSKGSKKKSGGFICLVKSSQQVVIVKTKRRMGDIAAVEALIASVADAIRRGSFPMCNPTAWNCSAKWCGYWGLCRGKHLAGRK